MNRKMQTVATAWALTLAACATPAGSTATDASTAAETADAAKPVAVDSNDPGPVDTKMFGDLKADAAKPDAADEVTTPDATAADTPTTDAPADTAKPDSGPAPDVSIDASATECPVGSFKPPKGDGKCVEATCANMAAAVSAVIAYAQTKYEQGCNADSDCTVASTSTACSGTCGIAIVKTAAAALATDMAAVDSQICKPFDYGGKCGFATPSCMEPTPGCVSGKCVYSKQPITKCVPPQPANTVCEGTLWVCKPGYFKGYGGGECLEATCDNLAKAKNDAIDSIATKSKVCGAGEECAVVASSTDCGGTCGVAVNAGMSSDVQKIVGWVDDNLCKKFDFKAKCGYATPKCMAPKPACKQGSCWYNDTVP